MLSAPLKTFDQIKLMFSTENTKKSADFSTKSQIAIIQLTDIPFLFQVALSV